MDNTGGITTFMILYNLGNSSKYSFMTFHSVVVIQQVVCQWNLVVVCYHKQAQLMVRVLINDDSDFDVFL